MVVEEMQLSIVTFRNARVLSLVAVFLGSSEGDKKAGQALALQLVEREMRIAHARTLFRNGDVILR